MGRPSLALGTHGRVRTYRLPGGRWRAMTLYRDWDGVTRQVERQAKTKGGAERALALALRDRAGTSTGASVTPDTKVSVIAEKWYAELQDKSPSTMQAYRDRLDRQILPALGNLKLRELTVGIVDRHLGSVKNTSGPAMAKMTKSVLSGICRLAARHDALRTNPCRDVAPISSQPRRVPRVLSTNELRAVRAWFAADCKATERDLPDLVGLLAATGLRIGEACALTWADVDLSAGAISVRGTVVRIKGQGLVTSRPKSAAGARVLELPSWATEMLKRRRRRDKLTTSAGDPVFPAPLTKALRDPSNTRRALREAFAEMGLSGVTSHSFRRSVATLMDEAGLSARTTADQLGHARPSLTMDV